jgi:hypothetical protein
MPPKILPHQANPSPELSEGKKAAAKAINTIAKLAEQVAILSDKIDMVLEALEVINQESFDARLMLTEERELRQREVGERRNRDWRNTPSPPMATNMEIPPPPSFQL